ncbi:acid protease [Peniophora sp. CONT]|nr:acid protease [Peniophora sp. CONT]
MLPSIAALALASYAAAAPAPEPASGSTIHVPVSRRAVSPRKPNGDADLELISSWVDHARAKYNFGASSSKRGLESRQNSNGTGIQITDVGFDSSYIGTVSIGTPAQNLEVVLDTGSSDLWVATTGCTSCPSGTTEFNTGDTSSFKSSGNSVTFQYGSGQASGQVGTDTVSMGGFTVNGATVTGVTSVSNNIITGPVSGIMGLGFQALSNTQSTPFWQSLLNSNQLANPEMSFYIARNAASITSNDQETNGGIFTLGGTNSSLFQGDIDFNNFPQGSQASYWLQTVSQLTLNGNTIDIGDSGSNTAAIDTGTTLLGGPSQAVNAFWSQVSGARNLSNGMFAFPCDTDLSVTLSFGGKQWPIKSEDINFGSIGQGYCQGAIFDVTQGAATNQNTPSWIVGDTFLKNVYSVFRASPGPAVGFAELSGSASAGTPGGSSNTNSNTGNTSGAVGRKGVSAVMMFAAAAATAAFMA